MQPNITEIQKFIAMRKKKPINKFLSYLILGKLNEGCSKYKCFIEKTHKDIFEDIFEIYNDDRDFNNFLSGWNTKQEEVRLLVRIELYKLLDFQYIKENKSHNKIITYTLTKKGQNYLQSSLSNWFYFESGRCEIEGVIYGN
jgi:hypothetical protein|tara:strand:+ start:59 stop:484 length:426 start_codon:yes stop_codon:yes gene_type:complete